MENDVARSGTFRAVTVVAVLLVAAVLYVAREVFIPFALALLLSFLLAPLVGVDEIINWFTATFAGKTVGLVVAGSGMAVVTAVAVRGVSLVASAPAGRW